MGWSLVTKVVSGRLIDPAGRNASEARRRAWCRGQHHVAHCHAVKSHGPAEYRADPPLRDMNNTLCGSHQNLGAASRGGERVIEPAAQKEFPVLRMGRG